MPSDNNQEMFPIVDEQGNITGAATRGECHSGSKLLHPVIHLHVFNSKGDLYLQKRPQILHLIFHQGDKRGDDDTNALLGESGHLKCNRLTASGRHQSQCVFAFADTGDDLLLQVAEGVITPVLF